MGPGTGLSPEASLCLLRWDGALDVVSVLTPPATLSNVHSRTFDFAGAPALAGWLAGVLGCRAVGRCP